MAALREHVARGDRFLYGTQWGDPRHGTLRYLIDRYLRGRKVPGDLSRVVRSYIEPFVDADTIALEIGSGGGRWTQFLLRAKNLTVAEVTPEFFEYLERRFGPRFTFYETRGDELSGIADDAMDFVFSFGTLVHLPVETVQAYVEESYRVLRPRGVAVLQYADKSKPAAQLPGPRDHGFSDTTWETFPPMAEAVGFAVETHDRDLLNHSNIAVLRKV